jgi:hypothetical protein
MSSVRERMVDETERKGGEAEQSRLRQAIDRDELPLRVLPRLEREAK